MMGAKKRGRKIRSGNKRVAHFERVYRQAARISQAVNEQIVHHAIQVLRRKITMLEDKLRCAEGGNNPGKWLAEMVETCRRHNAGQITNDQCRAILKNLISAAYAGMPEGGYGRLQQPDVIHIDCKEKVLTPDQQKDLFKKNGSPTV